ncbi:glycosyl hydrolase family protein [Hirsutella rhossiliensis]|uniref:Mannan endo-1,6-alpha-mannosidase n=1 Tax=Hirsutella rhossiliensis TaxID=111463 RepID=A0A9P8N5K6_9HYPO|nr:glycosyl hydrolase family protein [Hirsutella rhossiliensis]KAH0967382.1 glycosyl hydrolase family protein [Hirsutella rhossiliensis]
MISSRLTPSLSQTWRLFLAGFLLLCGAEAQAVSPYKIDTRDNILESARTLAYDLMLFYPGNKTGGIPGTLPGPPPAGPYYWWEGGAMMGTYIDYWHLTGDSSYNKVVMEGMLHQVGDKENFMPANHTASLGNDDQGFWGMSAMLAAENKFPNPPDDKPQWLALAQAVWNTMADPSRHDETCNGGLRWQIPFSNAGYNYKNTIANGCYFNIGARLARYTHNKTYAEHADQTWNWLWGTGYIDNKSWRVYDGAHVDRNCTDINKATFSYNTAVMLQGAAFMYNFTDGEKKWADRVEKLTEVILTDFFPKNIAYEVPCEMRKGACSPDMLSFKGYVHRWLAVVTQIAPFTKPKILPTLQKSAEAGVKQCTGGASGRQCGFYWSDGTFTDPGVDKTSGAGEAMNVLAAVSSLLIEQATPPVTNSTGGISKGNVNAGGGRDNGGEELRPITGGDRAGAGILTFLLLGSAVGTFVWMSVLG